MTATDARIYRLSTILAQECPNLDVAQIRPLLEDLRDDAQKEGLAGERIRVLSLLAAKQRFLTANRGRGWRKELDDLFNEIDKGTAFLFGDAQC
jgi:hypothetical protein